MTDSGHAGAGAGDAIDRAFELLAHPHRRYALSALRERDCRMTLAEVTRAVVLRSREVTLGGAREEFDQVRLALFHVHLPKLADAGVVEYDPDERTVALAAAGPTVRLLDDLAFVESS